MPDSTISGQNSAMIMSDDRYFWITLAAELPRINPHIGNIMYEPYCSAFSENWFCRTKGKNVPELKNSKVGSHLNDAAVKNCLSVINDA